MTNGNRLICSIVCMCFGMALSEQYVDFSKIDPNYGKDYVFPSFDSIFTPDTGAPKGAQFRDIDNTGTGGYGDTNTGYGSTGYGDNKGYGDNPIGYDGYTLYDGKDTSDYGKDTSGYGKDPKEYGKVPDGYGKDPTGYGKDPKEYGKVPDGYGKDPTGYGKDPKEYGKVPAGYGKDDGYNTKGEYDDGKYSNTGYGKVKPVPKCVTEMLFTFDNKKKPFEEIKNRIYANPVGKVKVKDGAAQFFGFGHIEIPYFKKNDLRPSFFLSIVVQPKGSGEPQTILSNSLKPQFATFTLISEGDRVFLVIVERPLEKEGYGPVKKSKPIVLSVRINRNQLTRINVKQDDTKVTLSAGKERQTTYARIPAVSPKPLYIGAGSSAVGTFAPFKGLVDEFLFDKCPLNTPGY